MSLVEIGGRFGWPFFSTIFVDATDGTLDADAEKIALCLYPAKAGTVRYIGFRTSTIVGTPTIKVSIQGVNASGDPDGVVAASGTQAVASNTFYEVTLGVGAAVVGETPIAIVFENNAFVGGDSIAVKQRSLGSILSGSIPYVDNYLGAPPSAWAKAFAAPVCGLRYDGETNASWAHGLMCAYGAVQTYQQDTTPDEYGNAFQLPFGARCVGAWITRKQDAGWRNGSVILYSGVTALESVVVDRDQSHGVTTGLNMLFTFGVAQTLLPNTVYRIAYQPSDAVDDTLIESIIFPSLSAMGAQQGGVNTYGCARTDAGAWTDYNSGTFKSYSMGVLLDAIDFPAGGYGAGHGMTGGIPT